MYKEDYQIIKSRLLDNIMLDIDKREGSFTNDIESSNAMEYERLYSKLDEVNNLMFVDTATGQDLDNVCNMFGVPRKLGEKAHGTVRIYAPIGTLIPRGLELFTDGDLCYVVQEQYFMQEEFKDTLVEAKSVGTTSNIIANAEWIIPIEVDITKIENLSEFTGGVDIESDNDLKIRFFDTVQNTRTSGNVNDYKYWAKEVNGVVNADVFPLWSGNGTVKVVASGINRVALDSQTLEACKQNIENKCPIGATVTVLTTTNFEVSVVCTLEFDVNYNRDTVVANVKEAITNYIGNCIDKIYRNKLASAIISVEGVVDYSVLTVNGATDTIINIPSEGVANITSITVN